jgi:peptide-O-fucosyltransferase
LKRTGAKHAYVASDHDHMIKKFQKRFKDVQFTKYDTENPHVDLAILGKSDHAIVNCVSTFSAFLKRQRDSENKKTDFWAFKERKKQYSNEEL